jgi:uncharacterized protein (TIGR02452 family)
LKIIHTNPLNILYKNNIINNNKMDFNTRKLNIDKQKETILSCQNMTYNVVNGNGDSVVVKLNKNIIDDSINGTKKISSNMIQHTPNFNFDIAKISKVEVVSDDCLDVALKCKDDGYDPVVLNMAYNLKPGGGYMKGFASQEASLFKRTNLVQCLDESFYPLNEDSLYTPNAYVIRNSDDTMMINPKQMSFISISPYKCNKSTDYMGTNMLIPKIANIVYNRIEHIFETAKKFNHDCIILSAFGCGVYTNPPEHIALIFKSVIESNKYNHHFKKIIFAIIDDTNSKTNSIVGNHTAFKNAFNNNDTKDEVIEI